MAAKKNFLDTDSNIFEQNLRFVRNDLEDELKQYFGGSEAADSTNIGTGVVVPPRDFKVVTPIPGFCIKSFKVNTNEKYFINVCQAIEIPAPEDISDEQLTEILQSDAPSSFRIPMSISEPRITKDKSNNPVDVCDIAINPKFFTKCEKSYLFKDFFLTLVAEALNDKYNVQIKMDKSIILNKRKFIGSLVSHRVRNHDVKTVLKSYQNPTDDDKDKLKQLSGVASTAKKPLVQEVDGNEIEALKQKSEHKMKKNSSTSVDDSMEPKFELRAKLKGEIVDEICAEFYLPKCISSQEITLDIGEDRILLESKKHGYLFDKFINTHPLNQDRVNAIFNKTNKMLQVRIPVLPVK